MLEIQIRIQILPIPVISKHPAVGLILIIYYAYDIHWYNAYQKQQKELLSGFVLMFLFTELSVKSYCFFRVIHETSFQGN